MCIHARLSICLYARDFHLLSGRQLSVYNAHIGFYRNERETNLQGGEEGQVGVSQMNGKSDASNKVGRRRHDGMRWHSEGGGEEGKRVEKRRSKISQERVG